MITRMNREQAIPVAARGERPMPPSPRRNRTLPIIFVLTVLLLLAAGLAFYFYYQYHNTPQEKDTKEITELTKVIGVFVELPEDETPTLATVTDREKLSDQPFFRKAENGDKVLIYTNGGRAILYRPSTQKIVDMTTVNVSASVPSAAATAPLDASVSQDAPAPETESVRVTLSNGSTKIGTTNTFEDEIVAQFESVKVIGKNKAARSDYEGNLLIDLTGSNGDLAKKIADTFGGTLGTLPSGETAPANTDLLIIVGNKK